MRCGPSSAQPSLVAKLSCSNKLARPMMRFCESRRQIQRRAWFCSPNIKPKGEDSEAIAGSRRRGKGLWFSILLQPRIDINNSPRLTTWAAEAISDLIQNEFFLKATIKPPNDVEINGRKVAGVLVEMRAQEKAPHLAIA